MPCFSVLIIGSVPNSTYASGEKRPVVADWHNIQKSQWLTCMADLTSSKPQPHVKLNLNKKPLFMPKKNTQTLTSIATKLRRSSFFEDFLPKIHLRLRLRPTSKSRRIFEASKILCRRFRRFYAEDSKDFWEKNHLLLKKFWGKMEENRSIFWIKIKIKKTFWCPKFLKWSTSSEFFSQYILFKLRIFLSIILKIFGSSNIFKEIPIFEGLRRFFKIPKNLRLRLRSIFEILRFFVFVFGPFSIFIATLTLTPNPKLDLDYSNATALWSWFVKSQMSTQREL